MNNINNIPIILASLSPRRHELLKQVIPQFTIIPANIQEDMSIDLTPENLAMELAKQKALHVAKNYSNSIVIGADTIVCHENKLLGKPKNEQEAYEMLYLLSNSKQSVITGVTIVYNDIIQSFYDKTDLCFHELPENFIIEYVKSGEPFDKSGGYGIQSFNDKYLKEINGDINNVIGFPVDKFKIQYDIFLKKLN